MFGSIPITPKRISTQLKKYKQIYAEDGKEGLYWSLKDFLHKVRKSLFALEKFYIYEMRLDEFDESNLIKPRVEGLRVKPIYIPLPLQDYENLGNAGVDFEKLPGAKEYEKGMTNGTIVFLTFKGDILMNRTGMTLYRNGVYVYNYPGERDQGLTVYAGFSETTKSARRMGIYSFVHSYIYKYLKEMGFKNVVLVESIEQPGPRKVQDRLGVRIISINYCLRILFFFNYWIKTKRISE